MCAPPCPPLPGSFFLYKQQLGRLEPWLCLVLIAGYQKVSLFHHRRSPGRKKRKETKGRKPQTEGTEARREETQGQGATLFSLAPGLEDHRGQCEVALPVMCLLLALFVLCLSGKDLSRGGAEETEVWWAVTMAFWLGYELRTLS